VQQDEGKLADCHAEFNGTKPRGMPRLIFGPLASGAAVIADKTIFEKLQAEQHRKLLGLEMEAYGVLLAVEELPHPQPEAFVIKAVQDYADHDKSDKYRGYACHVSSAVLKITVENYLN